VICRPCASRGLRSPDAAANARAGQLSTPLLAVDGVSRRFPGVLANDEVSLTLQRGEVLGLLGENGAGKSTLMNILAGIVSPDAGEIRVDGRVADLRTPRHAAAAGIGMVHQHFTLIGAMSVCDNLALGERRVGGFLVDRGAIARRAAALARELRIELDLDAQVDALSVGQQQQVEIVKALSGDPAILILDEPTAVLAPEERAGLFDLLARLAAKGTGVVLISHRLEDIMACCDRVVVLRHGRVVGSGAVAGLARDDLIRMVIGDEIVPVERAPAVPGEAVLSVQDLVLHRANGTPAIDGASFTVHRHEIVALCGVEGNGQSELVQIVAGMQSPDGGTIDYRLRGSPLIGPQGVATLRQHGVAHIAEDRLRHAVLGDLSLADNWLLTALFPRALAPHGWLDRAEAARQCTAALRQFDIKARDAMVPLAHLSGGNQQKLVLARELHDEPPLVIAAHPTRGLDARTIAFVQGQLLQARDRGAGVLLLTADLDEVWALADRVMVMSAGRLHGPVPVGSTSRHQVGHWMTGPR